MNEEINTSFVNEHISYLKILSPIISKKTTKTENDLSRTIKPSGYCNIALTTLRNVIDLKRNIDSTFKNEPNYQIKKKNWFAWTRNGGISRH